jgi:hypothetical protein
MKVTQSNNILSFSFENKVDYSISSLFSKVVLASRSHQFQIIELNFSKTRFVTLAGAMYLLFIVSSLIKSKATSRFNIETIITNCSKNLLEALANFGFFRVITTYGNLHGDIYIKNLSESKYTYWRNVLKQNPINISSVYQPISPIPDKNGENFEGDTKLYLNSFIDCFDVIWSNKMVIDMNNDILENSRKSFITAVYEATKNVWDHSESWGIGAIQSNKRNKTTFCLFDFGIGFINSYIKRMGNFERNLNNDKAKLNWLFNEHNSSVDPVIVKEASSSNSFNNHGLGLSRIAKFVDRTNGTWLIRTDKYQLLYKSKQIKISETTFFPGTQLMINF